MGASRKILAEGDELTVPSGFREAMGLKPGDPVLVELQGDELHIRPEFSGLRRAQQMLAPYAPKAGEALLSDQLIAERRVEAERE